MGTHPIFESDFDCLTEWVDQDHVRVIDENDPNHVIAIDDVMSMIDGGMIVDARGDAHVIVMVVVVKLQKRERIQFAGSKSLPNQSNRPIARPSWVRWSCSCVKTLCLKQPKTFDNCVRWRKATAIKDHPFIVLFPASCVKVVILPSTMEPVESQSMVKNSLMKISS